MHTDVIRPGAAGQAGHLLDHAWVLRDRLHAGAARHDERVDRDFDLGQRRVGRDRQAARRAHRTRSAAAITTRSRGRASGAGVGRRR